MKPINDALLELKHRNRLLAWGIFGLGVVWLLTLLILMIFRTRPIDDSYSDGILRVRGLVVVDDKGTERVWIGSPLPEPLSLGKRHPRGGKVSGILLFDGEGNERGGYVTDDNYPNVFFTLDGLGQQHVLFITEPQGSPSLWLWDANNNSFKLNVDEESPNLKLTRQGNVILKIPPTEHEEK